MSRKFLCLIFLVITCSFAASAQVAAQATSILVCAINRDGTNLRRIKQFDQFFRIGSPALSPDGKTLAFDALEPGLDWSDSKLMTLELATGESTLLWPGAMPTWSQDGTSLVYSSYHPNGLFERTLDGEASMEIDRGWSIKLSPNGHLHAHTNGGNLTVSNIQTGLTRQIQPDPQRPFSQIIYNFGWSNDNRRIAFAGVRADGAREIAIIDVLAENPTAYVSFPMGSFGERLSWRPQSEEIAATKFEKFAQIYIFKAEENATPVRLAGQPENRWNTNTVWSHDGKMLYFFSAERPPAE